MLREKDVVGDQLVRGRTGTLFELRELSRGQPLKLLSSGFSAGIMKVSVSPVVPSAPFPIGKGDTDKREKGFVYKHYHTRGKRALRELSQT